MIFIDKYRLFISCFFILHEKSAFQKICNSKGSLNMQSLMFLWSFYKYSKAKQNSHNLLCIFKGLNLFNNNLQNNYLALDKTKKFSFRVRRPVWFEQRRQLSQPSRQFHLHTKWVTWVSITERADWSTK